MASTYISDHIFRPTPPLHVTSRQVNKHSVAILQNLKNPKLGTFFLKREQKCKCRMSLVEQTPSNTKVDIKRLVGFLYENLPHLFDEQGIDPTAYDDRVKFRDPITKYDSISGYLLNIGLLKKLFAPDFILHWVRPTGPYEITTRWIMVMKFVLLPWKPELVFTGTSVMGINPETEKFNSHTDYWDSIKNNSYFSTEGLLDMIKQLRIYKTPDLESPRYKILKRTANYEVREYSPFVVVETDGDKLSGSTGFNSVAGYIFGKNSTQEKIKMTTPVFTQTDDPEKSKISIQIVIPSEKEISSYRLTVNYTVRLHTTSLYGAPPHYFAPHHEYYHTLPHSEALVAAHHQQQQQQIHMFKPSQVAALEKSSPESDRTGSVEDEKSESGGESKGLAALRVEGDESNGSEITLKF